MALGDFSQEWDDEAAMARREAALATRHARLTTAGGGPAHARAQAACDAQRAVRAAALQARE
ncbi:MAG: hypothetical protein R3F60_29175, partial [bacterium]